jgi:hypothetical protein
MTSDGLGIWIGAGAGISAVGVIIGLDQHVPIWASYGGWIIVAAGVSIIMASAIAWLRSTENSFVRSTFRRLVSGVRSLWLIPVERAARFIYDMTHAADILAAAEGQPASDTARLHWHLLRIQHDAGFQRASGVRLYGRRIPEGTFRRIPSTVHALSGLQLQFGSAHLTDTSGIESVRYENVSISPVSLLRSWWRLRRIVLRNPYGNASAT